jgi:hypothetical protein
MLNTLVIETLILVAIWEKPFIFQGYFFITSKQTSLRQYLWFRCEYHKAGCVDEIDDAFSFDDYVFTEVYNEDTTIQWCDGDWQYEQPLHALKYALHTTLQLMLRRHQKKTLIMDEVAINNIVTQFKNHQFNSNAYAKMVDIGFAVSMDFNPTEAVGQQVALMLLGETSLNNRIH